MDEDRMNDGGMQDEDRQQRQLEGRTGGGITLQQQARMSSEIAQRISREAMQQWQKAVTGMIAFPAALALGWASMAMYAALFLERGFAVFQEETGQTLGRMSSDLSQMEGRDRDQQRLYQGGRDLSKQPRA
jgi:hypothetical protein